MIKLRLAAGGRIAVNAADVAIAQTSPWGSLIKIASTGKIFEVEHSLNDLEELMPTLWLHGPDAIMNPDLIATVQEEEGGRLQYTFQGGLSFTQDSAFLDSLLDTLEEARRHRESAASGSVKD